MLIIAVAGLDLSRDEQEWLSHPAVGGVTLFARNFRDRVQVQHLIQSIRRSASRSLLVCVDQEGGPVQRFREGFTRLPALDGLGRLYASAPAAALERAEEHAWLMASEMRAIDVDLSFAPVIDLARGNRAIGARAIDSQPEVVALLGAAYVRGMRLAGMAATLKHFPGHGSVAEDTHFEHAVDPRELSVLLAEDMLPFREGIEAGAEAVMMAHVVYPAVDGVPAGYSPRWIAGILRNDLGFKGVVMSDDIGMFGASTLESVADRVHAHLDAGCDAVLVCQPQTVPAALGAMEDRTSPVAPPVAALAGRAAPGWQSLADNPHRTEVIARLAMLDAERST